MRIDLHTHFTPPRFFDMLGEHGGFEELEALKPYGGPMASKYMAFLFPDGEEGFIQKWIADMDSREIDQLIMSVNVQPYFTGRQQAVAAARASNEILRDGAALGNKRLGAFGAIPLPHADAAVTEIAYALDELGFAGINMGCSAAGRPLDDPEFEPVWAELNDRAATVYLHPGQTPLMGVGSADFSLGASFCSGAEVALAVSRLICTKLTLRYPNVRIVAACLGGSIPQFAQRWFDHMKLTNSALFEELDGVLPHLKKIWYDTGIEDDYAFDAVRRTVGADRLVLGSDSPRGPVSAAVDQVTASEFLTDAEKKLILDHNGAQALGTTTD